MDGAERRVEIMVMNGHTRAFKITRRAAIRGIAGSLFLGLPAVRITAQENEITRQPVQSSVLAAAGYDAKRRRLEIEFHSGAIYRYLEVPQEIFRRLLAAESKGQFFGAAIRGKFRSELVKPRKAK